MNGFAARPLSLVNRFEARPLSLVNRFAPCPLSLVNGFAARPLSLVNGFAARPLSRFCLLALAVTLLACRPGGGSGDSAAKAPGPAARVDPAPLPPGPATAVVKLEPNTPTPVLDGPFLVTTINPAGEMVLAIAASHDCGAADLLWFAYSGGGVAVGKGQTLCVRSVAGEPRTNGFSGHSM